MLNYKSGLADRPFWNMLSINPILYRGQLQLFMANLQDYTYHIGKLVCLSPSQFCRAAQHFQKTRSIAQHLDPLKLAKPAIYEADDDIAQQCVEPQEAS